MAYKDKNKEKEHKRQYYLINKDEIRKKDRKYVFEHKEQIKENQKRYRIENKARIRNSQRKWTRENNKKLNDYQKNWKKSNRELKFIFDYRRIDKKKNRICDLTVEWLKENITSKPCVYCSQTENVGCDRVDNKKGHTMNNVVPCCTICNVVRGDKFTSDEMKLIGKAIKIINQNRLYL